MKKYSLIILFLVVLNFLIRIIFLNFPAHWDEVVYFEGALEVFKNHLNPFVEFYSYKPPLLFELTAIFYKFFGVSRWAGRLIIALFSSLSIFLTYKLGKKIFNPKVGLWASILLFFSPLFFTQNNLFHAAVPMTALFLATIYFYVNKKFWLYFLCGTLLVLTKEPSVLIIISISCFDCFLNSRKYSLRDLIKKELLILSPLVFFIAWLFLNKYFLGWYLWPYNLSYFTFFNRPYGRDSLNTFFMVSFIEYFLWFIFGFIFFALLFSTGIKNLKKIVFNKWVLYFFVISLFFPFLFYFGAFLPRYFLFTLPGLFLSFSWVLDKILIKERLKFFILFVICLIFIMTPINSVFFNKEIPGWAGEREMSYLRMVRTSKQAAEFVQKEFPGVIILARWPLSYVFDSSNNGYVESDFEVKYYNGCQNIEEIKKDFLLIFTSIGIPDDKAKLDLECIREKGFDLIKQIEWVSIYQKEI